MGRNTSGQRLGRGRADGLWGALAAAVAVALAAAAGAVAWLEYRAYDAATRITAPAPLPEISIIGMDDASVGTLGAGPWPRDVYARLIDQLSAAGAKTIVLTPALTEPQSDRGLAYIRRMREALARAGETSPLTAELDRVAAEAETTLDTDARLAASLQRAGNVFLASRYARTGTPRPLPPEVERSALSDPGEFSVPVQAAQHPVAALGAAAAGVGHWFAEADDDGQVRQVPLLLRYGNAAIPSLALLAARHSLHLGAGDTMLQGSPPSLRLAGLPIATDTAAVLRPRFHAVPEDGAPPFPTYSFASALNGKVPPQNFKDKIVLVGETSDALATPWAAPDGRAMYPVELLAHTVSSIRQSLGVQRPAWATAACWAAVLGALLFVAGVLPRLSRASGWVASVALALVLAGAEWGLLRHAGWWVPLLASALALLAGTAGWTLARFAHAAPSASSASAEAAEADRMMGLALQGQGQLDKAFERLRKVPPSDALMDNLYHLAQDFERLRSPAKAKAVYKHILQFNREYKDVRARYKRVRALLQGADTPSVPPASAAPRLPGDAGGGIPMLGRYQIDKEIGKGAMGVVYLGRDPKIGRVVAIKTLALSEEFEGDALIDARARFFREAETAGRLQHPNIVTIFDAGEEHDLAYIAMEFLKGADLAPACQAGQLLPVATVLSITARVADALDYAHAHQVVHRDIKPANIMFDSATDAVKVTDFGIARITDSSKTRTGLVLGTPSFMSPEQLAGKKVDGRTDVYSLGVTLFQLLTGSLPLRGDSMPELMHKIASVDAPDVRQLRPELSPAVAQVVARALHKRPESRYQTGRQMAAELRQAAAAGAGQKGMPASGAVVYDADRDATGQDMVDFQQTVMEPPAGRDAASPPTPGAR